MCEQAQPRVVLFFCSLSLSLAPWLFVRTRRKALFHSRLQAAQIKTNKHKNWKIQHQREGHSVAFDLFFRHITMPSKCKDSREQRTGDCCWLYYHLGDNFCIRSLGANTGTWTTGEFWWTHRCICSLSDIEMKRNSQVKSSKTKPRPLNRYPGLNVYVHLHEHKQNTLVV